MRHKPLKDRILVKPDEPGEKTKGGIIIPDSAKQVQQKGKVVATGDGTKDTPMMIKTGDLVIYGKTTGIEINLDGIDYLIMREDDVLIIER